MRTRPPDLSDQQLRAVLAAHWDIAAPTATYLPVGFGSHHWLVDDGRRWFVTVDELAARRWTSVEPARTTFARFDAALTAARELADRGLRFVVAPEPTIDGDVLVPMADRFAVAVYPYIEGTTREFGDVLTAEERLTVLRLIIDVHAATGSSARTEDLVGPMRDELLTALDDLDSAWAGGPWSEPTRRLLRDHHEAVHRRLDELDRLAARALAQSERFVLTHGEPHPGNTLTTIAGVLLVDWDTALLAPPERDLRMIADTPYDRRVLHAYTAATGTTVDHATMEMYRLHWDATEIALYTALLRAPHGDTEDIRESFVNLRSCVAAAA